jgi:hypothetical protein
MVRTQTRTSPTRTSDGRHHTSYLCCCEHEQQRIAMFAQQIEPFRPVCGPHTALSCIVVQTLNVVRAILHTNTCIALTNSLVTTERRHTRQTISVSLLSTKALTATPQRHSTTSQCDRAPSALALENSQLAHCSLNIRQHSRSNIIVNKTHLCSQIEAKSAGTRKNQTRDPYLSFFAHSTIANRCNNARAATNPPVSEPTASDNVCPSRSVFVSAVIENN